MPLEEYLQKFPELGPADTLSPQLIYEEYRVRQLYGDKPPIDSYRSRFPAQHEELEQLLKDQPLPTLTHGNQTPASPKPHDSTYLFEEFRALMG